MGVRVQANSPDTWGLAVAILLTANASATAEVFPLTDVFPLDEAGVYSLGVDVVATRDGFVAHWSPYASSDSAAVACFDTYGRIMRPDPAALPSTTFGSLASNGNDRVIVSWRQVVGDERMGVVARISPSCDTIIPPLTLTGDAPAPALAMRADGSFLATWRDQGAADGAVLAQFFDAEGRPVGERTVAVTADERQSSTSWKPAVAAIGASEYVVVWNERESEASHAHRLVGRRLAPRSPLAPSFTLVSADAFPDHYVGEGDGRTSAAAMRDGNLLLAWTATRKDWEFPWHLYSPNQSDVFVGSFSPFGTPLRARIQVTAAEPRGEFGYADPDVSVDSTGFVVSWTSYYASYSEPHATRERRLVIYTGTDAVLSARYSGNDFTRHDFQVAGTSDLYPSAPQYPFYPRDGRTASHEDGTFAIVWNGTVRGGDTPFARTFCDDDGTDLTCGTTRCRSVPRNPNGTALPTAKDALIFLRAAVALESCPVCVCDVDASGAVTSSDASLVLKRAVGDSVTLNCPRC